MSPASRVTAVSSSARRIETPDGPPAPVTSTRGASVGIQHRLGHLVAVELDDGRGAVAVAHGFQRLPVARRREPRPVARRGPQQLLVEVAPDLDLRDVGLDDLDLALQELVDG